MQELDGLPSWKEFKKAHDLIKPSIPESDIMIPRFNPVFQGAQSSITNVEAKEYKGCDKSKIKSRSISSPQKSSSVSTLDLSAAYRQGWSLGKVDHGSRNRPEIIKINVQEDIHSFQNRMLTGSSSLSSTYKSRSSRRDPLLWQVPNRQDGHLLTVHKAPVESPGPRYNLQAPPLNSSGTSRASQGFYSTSKDVVFPRARRMPDEPSRSPGPLQASLNPHAALSRQSKGAPRFDGSFRELHGSIYYKSFHSPSPGVIYDTLSHFDFESKRSGVTAAILGDLSVRKNRSKSREGKNKDDHETDVSDFTSHHRME